MTKKVVLKVDKGDEYTCALCGETFTAELSHDEAQAEYSRNFGKHPDFANPAVICDDCYNKLPVSRGIKP